MVVCCLQFNPFKKKKQRFKSDSIYLISVTCFLIIQESGTENVSNRSIYSKQLEAEDFDLKQENKEREGKAEKDSEEGDLEAKKKANQLKDDIALVISIFIILVLTAVVVFGKVKLMLTVF